jgi:6,7-dimethyl-8-ribityllumazine synthase
MVLNEDALEAMIRRQNAAAAKAPARGSELAEQTDEFEVYERPKDEETPETAVDSMPEPMVSAAQVPVEEFEEFTRAPAEPDMAASITAAPEPEMAAPTQDFASFRDSFQPKPTAPEAVPTHAPTPQAQATATRSWTTPPRIAVVQARFNEELTGPMAELATSTIAAQGGELHSHKTVAGVYDLPLVAQSLARRHDVDAVVVIGVVVQGSTKHDEIITHCTAKTLQEISLETQTPIGLGITGPGMTWEQAEARIGNAAHAVEAVLELLEEL